MLQQGTGFLWTRWAPFSMGRWTVAASLMLLMVASSLAGCVTESGDETGLDAVFTLSPANNIRVGDTVAFDASGSLPVPACRFLPVNRMKNIVLICLFLS